MTSHSHPTPTGPTPTGPIPAGPIPAGPIPTVALIGANGHGRWHRRRIAELQAAGAVRLVALADLTPVDPDPPVPPDVPVFAGHRELLAAARPDVVVICTPPHTHLPIALDAIDAGCDLLLEKPPVASLAAHRTLAAALNAAGRACQVGFQSLGSTAWTQFREMLRAGDLGPVTSLSAVASWQRADAYYTRAPWAGRRSVGGRAVIDGVLVNPLAHAVVQGLATAAAAGSGRLRQLTIERYRIRAIEVDDTAFARLGFAGGPDVLIAATLSGEDFIAGEIEARGEAGAAVLEYPTDRLALPGETSMAVVPGRTDLLTNLLAHRADGTGLLVPLAATREFTAVLEALTEPDLPLPHLLDDKYLDIHDGIRTIRGVNEVIRRAAETMLLPSELGTPWAVPPQTLRVPVG